MPATEHLAERCAQLAEQGAALTPISIRVALGIDDNTYNRWANGKIQTKIDGNKIEVDIDDSIVETKPELAKQKGIIERRRACLKKWLDFGEEKALVDVQEKSNRDNGGSMRIMENVFHYTAKSEQEQKLVSDLDDLAKLAADALKRRANND